MINLIELSLIFLYLQLLSIILLNNNNFIMILITIELIFLSLVLIACNLSFIYDDILGGLIALILLPLAGGESAIGLMLLISYYPDKGS
jgi:NADH-ubiquinone oxidoreductase chain 4L